MINPETQQVPTNPYINTQGWWSAPRGGIRSTRGYDWAKKQYSPQYSSSQKEQTPEKACPYF